MTTPQSADLLIFNYPPDADALATDLVNLHAARVNAFYIVNLMHDISYLYGFTEAAFNFQNNLFDRAGESGRENGNDRIEISVQDDTDTNNAEFVVPWELGMAPEMRIHLFARPYKYACSRDGAFQNDLIIHEYTHGITKRMTGAGAACLDTPEAAGLGEGWSDAMAIWMGRNNDTFPQFIFAEYALFPDGFRTYPTPGENNTRYSDATRHIKARKLHATGHVWASMLYGVYAALVTDRGFSETARTDPNGNQGNIVFLHLFMDALSLQGLQPTFVTAAESWYQADIDRYNGDHACILRTAFANRGLGANAQNCISERGSYLDANCVNDFTIPPACRVIREDEMQRAMEI